MCGNEQYVCKDVAFRLSTFGTKGVARLYLEKQYISLRLADLHYLREMFHVVQNQLNVFTLCLPDVSSYVTVALTSANYVEPAPNASRHLISASLRRTQNIIVTHCTSHCLIKANEIIFLCKLIVFHRFNNEL